MKIWNREEKEKLFYRRICSKIVDYDVAARKMLIYDDSEQELRALLRKRTDKNRRTRLEESIPRALELLVDLFELSTEIICLYNSFTNMFPNAKVLNDNVIKIIEKIGEDNKSQKESLIRSYSGFVKASLEVLTIER